MTLQSRSHPCQALGLSRLWRSSTVWDVYRAGYGPNERHDPVRVPVMHAANGPGANAIGTWLLQDVPRKRAALPAR